MTSGTRPGIEVVGAAGGIDVSCADVRAGAATRNTATTNEATNGRFMSLSVAEPRGLRKVTSLTRSRNRRHDARRRPGPDRHARRSARHSLVVLEADEDAVVGGVERDLAAAGDEYGKDTDAERAELARHRRSRRGQTLRRGHVRNADARDERHVRRPRVGGDRQDRRGADVRGGDRERGHAQRSGYIDDAGTARRGADRDDVRPGYGRGR